MRRARRAGAFTLFEVMAAVLVLGMLYTVLANAAMQGLYSEGETRRRLEASLIADRALAEIELQLSLGQTPPSGSAEQEEDPYLVSVTVQPFDPTVLLVPPEPGEAAPRASAQPTETLLAPPSSGSEGRLRRIDVRVSWPESGQERSVGRTTFAFDTTGLEALFPPEGGEGPGGTDLETAEDFRGLSPEQTFERLKELVGPGKAAR
jgi:type II secretory pathway pseudopilin PulG